jgi:hypothetical protein
MDKLDLESKLISQFGKGNMNNFKMRKLESEVISPFDSNDDNLLKPPRLTFNSKSAWISSNIQSNRKINEAG